MIKLLEQTDIIGTLKNNREIEIKVSFEDEGADFIDILKLRFICIEADVPITLKIGGPEAIRDIKDANKLNINRLVAPMIESSFALEKYIKACNRFLKGSSPYLAINIESIDAVNSFTKIRKSEFYKNLNGITIGRGDLVQSMRLKRYDGSVNSDEILEICTKIFTQVNNDNKLCTLGGSMTENSEEFVKKLTEMSLLHKFETRNIIYHTSSLNTFRFKELVNLALQLEYDQMNSRRKYYESLYNQDYQRIKRLSELF